MPLAREELVPIEVLASLVVLASMERRGDKAIHRAAEELLGTAMWVRGVPTLSKGN